MTTILTEAQVEEAAIWCANVLGDGFPDPLDLGAETVASGELKDVWHTFRDYLDDARTARRLWQHYNDNPTPEWLEREGRDNFMFYARQFGGVAIYELGVIMGGIQEEEK